MADNFSVDDLNDFMEVVMSYKCKFCQFISNSTQDMAYHVHSTHQKSKHLQDNSKDQVIETTSLHDSNTIQTYVYKTDSSLEDSADINPAINSSDCVAVTIDNIGAAADEIDNEILKETTNMDIADSIQNGSEILTLQSTSELGSHAKVITLTNQAISQADVVTLTSSSQTGSLSEDLTIPSTCETGSLSEDLTIPSTSETGSKPEVLTLISTSETVPELDEAVAINNIQFINQDMNGQYILQDGENVQFDNNSTVQVLIHDAEFEAQREDSEGVGKEFAEQIVEEKTDEIKTEGTQDDPQYIIEGKELYTKTQEKDMCHSEDTGTTDSQTECSPIAMLEDKPAEQPEQIELLTEAPADEAMNQTEMELFLCGNCRQGFTTIQDCKAHMTEEHGLIDTANQPKVDAGTQMEPRKKPGRKKKSEILAAAKEEVTEEPIAISDSDEDWSEKNEMYSYSKRSQRRRQPPQSLRKDFYLGRSKAKLQKKREDPGLNIKCTLKACNARFKEEETLKKHLDCHIVGAKSSEHQFKCLMCDEKFFFWKLARYHMWKTHKLDMGLLTCPTCLVFKTDTMSKLKVHSEIHGSERPYICGICGKAFKQVAQMKNHQALHAEYKLASARSGDSEKWHTPKTCDICERTFANAKCLKNHQEILHEQIKPYKCQYCDHECARKAMLILHERIHTGEKPFKCDMCHYTSGDHNSLRRHKMRHSGQRPYKCPHCPYTCIQAISLKVHVKSKHPGMGGIYSCSMCLYRTINMQQYENHLKDHKNGLIEKTVENADVQATPKTNAKQRKSKSLLEKYNYEMMISVPPNMNYPTQNVLMHNMSLPQIVQIPASAIQSMGQSEQLEMQIEMKEEPNPEMSNDGLMALSKITNDNGLVQSDMAAAQLIYSALSAISQNSQGDNSQVVAGVENGDIQTSIETDSSQGVTTHTITFHLPESEEVSGQQENIEGRVQKDPEQLTVIQVEGSEAWQGHPAVDLENV